MTTEFTLMKKYSVDVARKRKQQRRKGWIMKNTIV